MLKRIEKYLRDFRLRRRPKRWSTRRLYYVCVIGGEDEFRDDVTESLSTVSRQLPGELKESYRAMTHRYD